MENTQTKVGQVCRNLWRVVEDLLEQFKMENMADLEKEGSTHTIMEDVETRRNMSMKYIDETQETNHEIVGKIIVKPNQLILLIGHFIQQT
jgi:hypothetical protein